MILHIKVLRMLPGNCKSASGNPADLQDTKPTHRDLALLYTNNARGKREIKTILFTVTTKRKEKPYTSPQLPSSSGEKLKEFSLGC